MKLLILPHQIYKNIPDNVSEIYLYEHPQYFKKYKFNKKKLILHRASMKYFFDFLKKKYSVKYIEFNKKLPNHDFHLFDPIDKIKINSSWTIIDSPNFLLSSELMKQYRNKTKNFFFYNFYMWSKKQLDILPTQKSTDKENRKTIPNNIKLPNCPRTNNSKYVKEAIKYVEKHFPNNYGNSENFFYPITHTQAKNLLNSFIKNKLSKFGDYQDYIHTENDCLFHSILSSSINIGLLHPSDIVQSILKQKNKIKMNNIEGFIRQLFWREYQRYCYIYFNFKNKNYFGNKKKLTKKWYSGETGIKPVDDAIISGFDTGYLHHINRLMVIGNYMNLSGISPKQGFKWFMEFSCDSYEWVMHQNVLDMVFCVSGGKTMRRPYISSSNYILKMSNYKKDEWTENWDNLYQQFIKKNKKKLFKFRYYFRNL